MSKSDEEKNVLQDAYSELVRMYQSSSLSGKIMLLDANRQVEHAISVSNLSYAVAKELGLPDEDCYQLAIAGMLHDIGKLKLTVYIYEMEENPMVMDELKYVRMHSKLSYEELKDQDYSRLVLNSILHHHENYDGTGYPSNLSGEEIPLGARILRVCDMYSSLTSSNDYREAMDGKTAIDLMIHEVKNFDMRVFLAFRRVIQKSSHIVEEHAKI